MMLRAVPPLTSLKCFEVAARFESFTVAAEHLLRAPSAVSYQIRLLEEYLGKPLFVRTGKKVLLTADGRTYFEQVRKAFDLLADATRAVRSGDSDQRESIRISVAPSFGSAWLTPHLAGFFDLYPDLELHVSTESYPTSFGNGQIDCEIRYGDRALGKLEALPLCTERLVPLCNPSLLTGTDYSGLLADATLIHNEGRDINWQDYLNAYKVQRSGNGKSLFFDRSTYALDVARKGLGIALESTILAHEDLRTGRLVAPLGMTGIAGATYQLVAPDSQRLRSGKVFAFYSWLRQSLVAASEFDLQAETETGSEPLPYGA